MARRAGRAHAGEARRDRRAHFTLGDDARLRLQFEHGFVAISPDRALPILAEVFGYVTPQLRAATISTLANGVPSEAPNTSHDNPASVS